MIHVPRYRGHGSTGTLQQWVVSKSRARYKGTTAKQGTWHKSVHGITVHGSSTCSMSPMILKFYQRVRSVKKSKLAKFGSNIIIIYGVMASKKFRHDVKIRHDVKSISVKNVKITLKLSYFVLVIMYTDFSSFLGVDGNLQKYCHLQISYL